MSVFFTCIEHFFFFNSDPETVFQGMTFSDDVLKELLLIIKRRMTPHPVKIRARKCIYIVLEK